MKFSEQIESIRNAVKGIELDLTDVFNSAISDSIEMELELIKNRVIEIEQKVLKEEEKGYKLKTDKYRRIFCPLCGKALTKENNGSLTCSTRYCTIKNITLR